MQCAKCRCFRGHSLVAIWRHKSDLIIVRWPSLQYHSLKNCLRICHFSTGKSQKLFMFLIQMRHFIVILRTLWCVKKETKTKEWFANWFLVVYFYICFYCGFARFSRHENFSFAKKMLPHNSLLTKWIIDETCVFFQTLDKVEWSDAGIYSCLAKEVGSDGLPTRQDIILDIYGKSTASSNGLLQF